MGDNVKTGIRLEAEGEEEFVKALGKATGAMDDFSGASAGAAEATGKVREALGEAEKDASSSKARLDNLTAATLENVAKLENAASAVIDVSTALIGEVGAVAATGDAIDKNAKAIGFSTRAYQEWTYIMGRAGLNMKQLKSPLNQLTEAAADASDEQQKAFSSLGLSLEQVAGLSREQLFTSVIEGLQGIENADEQAALASVLLGKKAEELAPLLSMNVDEVEALRARVHQLGGVMSEDAVKASVEYQDSIQDIDTLLDGTRMQLLSSMIPALTTFRNGLLDTFTDRMDWDLFEKRMDQIAAKSVEFTDYLLTHGDDIAHTIEGIGGAWLTWKGAGIVKELAGDVKSLYGWLGKLGGVLGIGAGAAAGGLAVAAVGAATLVDHVHDLNSVGYLGSGRELQEYADNVAYYENEIAKWHERNDEFIQSGYTEGLEMMQNEIDTLVIGLGHAQEEYTAMQQAAEGAANAPTETADAAQRAVVTTQEASTEVLETIRETAGEIRDDFPEGLEGMAKAAGDEMKATNDTMAQAAEILSVNAGIWGEDMMISFANGIISGTNNWVLPAIEEKMAKAIEERIGFSEPDVGPLSRFHTFAPDMMKLFARGITDYTPLVTDAVTDAFNLGAYIETPPMTAGSSYNYGGVSVTFNVQDGQDGRALFEEFSYWLEQEMAREGAVYAQ